MHLARIACVLALAACGADPKPRDFDAVPLAVYDAGPPRDAGPSAPPSADAIAASTLRSCMTADPRDLEIAFDAARTAIKAHALSPELARGVWDCFARFRPSKAKMISIVRTIADLVRAAKDPSYGPLATSLIAVPIADGRSPEENMDEIQFHQNVSIQIVGDLAYAPAVSAMVTALTTRDKRDLVFPLRLALSKMPDAAEPALIAALDGTDTSCLVADALAAISRPPGRTAIVASIAKSKDDPIRACLALALPSFPSDPAAIAAYRKVTAKMPVNLDLLTMGSMNARAALLTSMANFFDPVLVGEMTSAVRSAKGATKDELEPVIPAVMKVMMPDDRASVAAIATSKLDKERFTAVADALDQCKKNLPCWLAILDEPLPQVVTAKMRHAKAAWMAAMLGNDATRSVLVTKIGTLDDPSVRLALLGAIDHLAPNGDAGAATAIEAIVAREMESGGIHLGVDEMIRLALRLRARALPSH